MAGKKGSTTLGILLGIEPPVANPAWPFHRSQKLKINLISYPACTYKPFGALCTLVSSRRVIPFARKYLIAPMAYREPGLTHRATKPRSPRGSALVNVKQWAVGAPVIDAASVPAEKPNRRSSERYQALERSKFSYEKENESRKQYPACREHQIRGCRAIIPSGTGVPGLKGTDPAKNASRYCCVCQP